MKDVPFIPFKVEVRYTVEVDEETYKAYTNYNHKVTLTRAEFRSDLKQYLMDNGVDGLEEIQADFFENTIGEALAGEEEF
jgi:hypothetical protein